MTSKKVRGNNVDFFTIEFTSRKGCGNNADFSIIETTSKKVRGNNVDFSNNKTTPIKVCGNNVYFSTIKITSKKFAEMTGKLVQIWYSTYRQNIHLESTWIPLWGAFRRFRIHANTLRKTQKKINKKNIIIKNALQVDLAKFVVDQGNGVIRQIFT